MYDSIDEAYWLLLYVVIPLIERAVEIHQADPDLHPNNMVTVYKRDLDRLRVLVRGDE